METIPLEGNLKVIVETIDNIAKELQAGNVISIYGDRLFLFKVLKTSQSELMLVTYVSQSYDPRFQTQDEAPTVQEYSIPYNLPSLRGLLSGTSSLSYLNERQTSVEG